jgi:5-methylcytosine-specific restriction endonuclease McrA
MRARYYCDYCLIREEDSGFPHQTDHIVTLKHGGDSAVDNLAYACGLCNRHKRGGHRFYRPAIGRNYPAIPSSKRPVGGSFPSQWRLS